MATKKSSKKTEEPVEEPVEELVEAPKKEAKSSEFEGYELPSPTWMGCSVEDFITESFKALKGRLPSEDELAHWENKISNEGQPRVSLHTSLV
tara:strand:- start:13480 stop:13758 length:279 start_codon:yes stop_codon:yes gene_type:complete